MIAILVCSGEEKILTVESVFFYSFNFNIIISWFCPHIALSYARSNMDGSSCCFNCVAMNPISSRWLIRKAYGIQGGDFEDVFSAWCCPCCSVNQLYQTTKAYGAPAADAGRQFNTGAFTTQASNENCCRNCMYSLCCCPCAIGTTMSQSVDMPFWMGCCCVNICMARNVVRYQYRIGGDDCCDDFCVPTMIAGLTYCLSGICPCAITCALPYFLNILMVMLSETEARSVKNNWPKQYLASNPQAMAVQQPVVILMQQPAPIMVATAPQQAQPVHQPAYKPAY